MSVVKYQQFLKSYVSVYNCTISRNTTTISKLVNTSFVIWSGQCIMLRNTALL